MGPEVGLRLTIFNREGDLQFFPSYNFVSLVESDFEFARLVAITRPASFIVS
jgi:hypothetical protein